MSEQAVMGLGTSPPQAAVVSWWCLINQEKEYSMDHVNFACPECGCEVFDTAAISEHPDSFAGAICADCGHVVTDDDTLESDEKLIDEVFGDLVGKLFK